MKKGKIFISEIRSFGTLKNTVNRRKNLLYDFMTLLGKTLEFCKRNLKVTKILTFLASRICRIGPLVNWGAKKSILEEMALGEKSDPIMQFICIQVSKQAGKLGAETEVHFHKLVAKRKIYKSWVVLLFYKFCKCFLKRSSFLDLYVLSRVSEIGPKQPLKIY